MPLLVTSASGANRNGYGALLAFDHDGEPLGPFSDDDRIVDPRGLAPDPEPGLLFLDSADRVLALDQARKVAHNTGVIAGLNPGGGPSDLTAATTLAYATLGLSWRCRPI